jgi:hypothetical protein
MAQLGCSTGRSTENDLNKLTVVVASQSRRVVVAADIVVVFVVFAIVVVVLDAKGVVDNADADHDSVDDPTKREMRADRNTRTTRVRLQLLLLLLAIS